MRKLGLYAMTAVIAFGVGLWTGHGLAGRGEATTLVAPPVDASARATHEGDLGVTARPGGPPASAAPAPRSGAVAATPTPRVPGPAPDACAALRTEVRSLRGAVAVEQAARAESEGTPIAFPEGLDARFREPALVAAFGDAARTAGATRATIDSVDCTEYPCLVYGTMPAAGEGVDAARARMETVERTMERAYPGAAKWFSASGFEPIAGQEGEPYVRFTLSFYPEPEPGAEADALDKRMHLRRDQYVEALPPTP